MNPAPCSQCTRAEFVSDTVLAVLVAIPVIGLLVWAAISAVRSCQ